MFTTFHHHILFPFAADVGNGTVSIVSWCTYYLTAEQCANKKLVGSRKSFAWQPHGDSFYNVTTYLQANHVNKQYG
jgi:hypothetical protein